MADEPKDFDPFTSPIIRPSWHAKIKLKDAPKTVRILGRTLTGKCCLWCGWHNSKPGGPYGLVRVGGRRWYIHRYVYMKYYGLELSSADFVDHICRNRLCFNPLHLEATDYLTNYERGDGPSFKYKPAQDYLSDDDVAALAGEYKNG